MATPMYLYKLNQSVNNEYDTFDSCVVCAETLDQAKLIHPSKGVKWNGIADDCYDSWCDWKHVNGYLLGKAHGGLKKGVICSSFNAG